MLDDVLARFGERHCEPHRRLRFEMQLVNENRLRLLLDALDDVVDVFALRDRRDLQQHARLAAVARARHVPMMRALT